LQLLLVFGLIELDREVTGRLHVGHEAVAVILDGGGELHSLALEVPNGRLDVITVERDVGRSRGRLVVLGGMYSQIRFRGVEDEPALPPTSVPLSPSLSRKNSRSSFASEE
jgi:hypothetical protein